MIQQSDVQGRLRLFRYGIVVVTITALVTTWFAPVALTAQLGEAGLSIGEAFMPALIVSVITAIIGVVAYFAYAQVLQRTIGGDTKSE